PQSHALTVPDSQDVYDTLVHTVDQEPKEAEVIQEMTETQGQPEVTGILETKDMAVTIHLSVA
ncbi:MAG: hypothetical protein ACKVKK_05945, partial [Flavobacteriales bacterium]